MLTLLFKFTGMGHRNYARSFMDSIDRDKIPIGILNHIESVEIHDDDPKFDREDLTCTGVVVRVGGHFTRMTLSIYAKYVMDAKSSQRYSAFTPWAYFDVPADVMLHDCKEHPLRDKPRRNPHAPTVHRHELTKEICEAPLCEVPIDTYIILYREGQSHAALRIPLEGAYKFSPATTTHNPITTYWCDKHRALETLDIIKSEWAYKYGVTAAKKLVVLQFKGVGRET